MSRLVFEYTVSEKIINEDKNVSLLIKSFVVDNCLPALILTLILKQTLTLTGRRGNFPWG